MGWGRVIAIAGVGLGLVGAPALASSMSIYQCADGGQFALAFYDGDSNAHIQLNGKALSLPKRLSFSGARYSASGVTLRIAKDGTTLKHPSAPLTTCKPLDKW